MDIHTLARQIVELNRIAVETGVAVDTVACLQLGLDLAMAVEEEPTIVQEIVAEMDGRQWNADTTMEIANILERHGINLAEPDEATAEGDDKE